MKVKHALILLVLGFCAVTAGALVKVMHWRGADVLFLLGLGMKIIGAILLLYKVITYPKIKDFLNR